MNPEEILNQAQFYINDLYHRLNLAWEDVTSLKAKVAELEAKLETAKQVEKKKTTPREYKPNPPGITVEKALQALEWSVRAGVFHESMSQFRSHYKEPKGDDNTAYQKIRNRIIGTAAPNNNDRFGQEWLDYWSDNYLTKSGTLKFSLGAYFMDIYETWRERKDQDAAGDYGFIDEKGNWFADAEEYCKEYGLPVLTEEQLIDSGDLFPV